MMKTILVFALVSLVSGNFEIGITKKINKRAIDAIKVHSLTVKLNKMRHKLGLPLILGNTIDL